MRTFMRNTILAAGTILLCAGGTAHASTTAVVQTNVPFSFEVNGQTLPAGRYTVERDDMSPSVLLIRGDGNTHAAVFVSTIPDSGHDPAGSRPALAFQRHGNQNRLTSIWESGTQGWDVVSR